MAVTATCYAQAVMALGVGGFDFASDTFKVMLTTAGYTPNELTDEFVTDLGSEVIGTGYTAGGLTLTGVTWTYDVAVECGSLRCDPAVWTAAGFTAARYAVVYQSTGSDATSRLLLYVDFEFDKSPGGADFVMDWTAEGFLQAYN